MRRNFTLAVLVFALALFLSSCTSTREMVDNPIVADTQTSLGQKMDSLGFPRIETGMIESFFDGSDWIVRLMELIEDSRDYIIFTSFLASECEENAELYDLICRKAEEGVRIYFMYDSAGALDMTETRFHLKPLNRLAESGVHMLEYNPFSFNRLPGLARMLVREHRKFFVFDGRMVAVGGMNLNYISTMSWLEGGQRDSMFCFESEDAAAYLVKQFVRSWNTYSWETLDIEDFMVPSGEGRLSGPTAWIINQDDYSRTMPALVGSIFNSAGEEVLVLPLMPLENDDTYRVIANAVERGVDVQMILPNDPRTNNYKAAHYSVSNLIGTGMKIYPEPDTPERSQLLHEKLMIIDSEYVLIGSLNLNYRSLVLSNEIGVLIHDPEFAGFMREHFMSLRDGCELLTEEDAQQWHKFGWYITYLIQFIMG